VLDSARYRFVRFPNLPTLFIDYSKASTPGPVVRVDGLPEAVAMEIPWGTIIDYLVGKLGPGTKKSGGKCISARGTSSDGRSTTVTSCEPG
jgi:hypothetical protein